jgi:multicomponent Na+:H+ antiporter subunit G
MRPEVALGFVVAGTLICVAASIGASLTPGLYERVHFLSPISSVGTPLLAVGLAVQDGLSFATGEILLIALLFALSAPAITAVTGRLIAQGEGRLEAENKAEYEPGR